MGGGVSCYHWGASYSYAFNLLDLDDEDNSDDLESEVERADLTSRRQCHQQPSRFSSPTSARSGSQGTVFYQIQNDLSQFVVKLQEHGQRVNLKFRAALGPERLQMFISPRVADEYVKHGRGAAENDRTSNSVYGREDQVYFKCK